MKIEAYIKKVYETKRGTIRDTDKKYVITDVWITWGYKEPGCDEQTFETLCSVSGEVNVNLLEAARTSSTKINCLVYFGAKEWNDKCYNRVSLKLPDAYMVKDSNDNKPL